jgi:hypothetical protein
MKRIILFSLLLFVLSGTISLRAQTCDSIRISYSYEKSYSNIFDQILRIDTIADNQIVSTSTGYWNSSSQTFQFGQALTYHWDTIGNQIFQYHGSSRTMYEYDSLGRLAILEIAYQDSSGWRINERTEYYFTVFDRDSLVLKYLRQNISGLILMEKISWEYDSLYRVRRKLTENFVSPNWLVTQDIRTTYPISPSNVVRIDSLFEDSFGILQMQLLYLYSYDSPDSISYISYESPFDTTYLQSAYRRYTSWNQCGMTLWSSSNVFSNGSGSSFTALFDSLCRCTISTRTTYSGGSGLSHYIIEHYYADCRNMAGFTTSSKTKICADDSLNLAAHVFGGTLPYSYQWSSTDGLMNDTVSHPRVAPDSTTTYICVVTDANQLQWTDTILIQVDPNPFRFSNLYLLSIDSTSACSTAEIVASNIAGHPYTWRHEGNNLNYYDTILQVKYNGLYTLDLGTGQCYKQLSLQLTELRHPAPDVSFSKGCNQVTAQSTSTSVVAFNWFMGNDTNSFFTGDTLYVTSNNYYSVVAVDSAGCKSAKLSLNFSVFKITPHFANACNDSCTGTAYVVVDNYSSQYSYLWSNGDQTWQADSLCNNALSVTVTDIVTGCQLTATDSCLNVSVSDYSVSNYAPISVYPNPASSTLRLDIDEQTFDFPLQWQVTDIYGRNVDEQTLSGNIIQLEKNKFRPGLYLFRIFSKGMLQGAGKFIFK